MMKEFGNKLIGYVMRFVNTKGVTALKDGMLSILPLTVAGSIFLVIGSIPSEAINTTIYAGSCWNFCDYGACCLFLNWVFICQIR